MKTRPDPPIVTRRARELAARKQVQYWVVLSCQDALDLLAGRVPDALRPQLHGLVKRDRAESVEEYSERMREATA
jgi:hypothetical protein